MRYVCITLPLSLFYLGIGISCCPAPETTAVNRNWKPEDFYRKQLHSYVDQLTDTAMAYEAIQKEVLEKKGNKLTARQKKLLKIKGKDLTAPEPALEYLLNLLSTLRTKEEELLDSFVRWETIRLGGGVVSEP